MIFPTMTSDVLTKKITKNCAGSSIAFPVADQAFKSPPYLLKVTKTSIKSNYIKLNKKQFSQRKKNLKTLKIKKKSKLANQATKSPPYLLKVKKLKKTSKLAHHQFKRSIYSYLFLNDI